MSVDLKDITMPAEDEIQHQLERAFNDQHASEHLYPKIAKRCAGRNINGYGIVGMLREEIHVYSQETRPVLAFQMELRLKDFIRALVDDDEAKADAISMIEQVDNILRERGVDER
jgi:hypothetical protein